MTILNLTNTEYHASEGISKSKLDRIHESPLAYWYEYINTNKVARGKSAALNLGTIAHAAILEPDIFETDYALPFDKSQYPDALDTTEDLKIELSNRSLPVSGTKPQLVQRLLDDGVPENKIMYVMQQKYADETQSRTILTDSEYAHVKSMKDAVHSHHAASILLDGATCEQSFFIRDGDGLTRKCRPDAISKNGKICIDIKTSNDISPSAFNWSIIKYRYHVQAAWYLDTLAMHDDNMPHVFSIIAVQKTEPYDVAVYVFSKDQISRGREEYRQDLVTLKRCLQFNQWPGVDDGKLIDVVLPDERNFKGDRDDY